MSENENGVDNGLREMLEDVPKEYAPRFRELIDLIDKFCDAHLNDEYRELCRDMAFMIYEEDLPVLKGKSEGWAAGIVSAVGFVNFLHDRSQTPHMLSSDIAKAFGVSLGTMQAKSRIIRDGLDLIPCDPAWCLPSKLDDNPLVWMLELKNGLIVDVRMAPREAQVDAYNKGLIPYIPADRHKSPGETRE